MATWSPNTARVIDNGFGGSREGVDIIGYIPHHVAGFDALGYVANANSRDSHPTYHISRTGVTTGIVHPDRRPFSTGNAVDKMVVTSETDNITGAPDWRVSDAAIASMIAVGRHHYSQSPRYGNGVALNEPGVTQREFIVGYHGQYSRGNECPGPHIRGMLGEIIAEINSGAKPVTIGDGTMARILTSVEGHAYLQTENGRAHIMHPTHMEFLERVISGKNLKFYEKELNVVEYYFTAANPAAANSARLKELAELVKSEVGKLAKGNA